MPTHDKRDLPDPRSLATRIAALDEEQRHAIFKGLDPHDLRRLANAWGYHARPAQLPPDGDWRVWLVMAGRGFGKTRAGAEWIDALARTHPGLSIALVGATHDDVRNVMIEGDAGIASLPRRARPSYQPSLRRLEWPNGSRATGFSAAEPESLRGPQHHFAWADEVARWGATRGDAGQRGIAAWDNLMMGLRLGDGPRVLATTTPRALPIVRHILATAGLVRTGGSTFDNQDNLPDSFIDGMRAQYGGTRLGRQEIGGELLEDVEGALWTRAMIERCRSDAATLDEDALTRVVIGVDPPASATGDACGIIVAGELKPAGPTRPPLAVLADCSVTRQPPAGWARAVARAAAHWRADLIVAEANNGGEMVRDVLHAADPALPVRLVHASRGKAARAEPFALLYERGEVVHFGALPALEDELCGLMPGGAYEGPGRSPDRADALVWALHELTRRRGHDPGIRST